MKNYWRAHCKICCRQLSKNEYLDQACAAAQAHALQGHSTEVWRWDKETGYGEEIGAAYAPGGNIETATITENQAKQKAYRNWYFSLEEAERWKVDQENRGE